MSHAGRVGSPPEHGHDASGLNGIKQLAVAGHADEFADRRHLRLSSYHKFENASHPLLGSVTIASLEAFPMLPNRKALEISLLTFSVAYSPKAKMYKV
jgi:hypothetical protein